MFGSLGTIAATSLTFISQARIPAPVRLAQESGCRLRDAATGKSDMKLNDAFPHADRSETYEVRADEELLTREPATILPLATLLFV